MLQQLADFWRLCRAEEASCSGMVHITDILELSQEKWCRSLKSFWHSGSSKAAQFGTLQSDCLPEAALSYFDNWRPPWWKHSAAEEEDFSFSPSRRTELFLITW